MIKRSKLTFKRTQHGFTLMEVMLVVLLIGIFLSIVSFNPFSNRPEDKLEDASARFTGIFNVAAEYGLLNNIELGLIIEKNSYQFVGYDGVKWSPLPDQEILAKKTLPEGLALTLELDDLPIDDQAMMLSGDKLFQEDDDFRGDEKEKKVVPKIFILSGGDFTSFRLIFSFTKEFEDELEEPIEYHVTGLFTLPLVIKGPLYNGQE
ncbi:MAG: type II secretion system minor pseudopilin GspH [Thalassotalea sp.]